MLRANRPCPSPLCISLGVLPGGYLLELHIANGRDPMEPFEYWETYFDCFPSGDRNLVHSLIQSNITWRWVCDLPSGSLRTSDPGNYICMKIRIS